jgi:hypothetical protein
VVSGPAVDHSPEALSDRGLAGALSFRLYALFETSRCSTCHPKITPFFMGRSDPFALETPEPAEDEDSLYLFIHPRARGYRSTIEENNDFHAETTLGCRRGFSGCRAN